MRTLVTLLVMVAAPAAAQGAGNLPPDFYPRPACQKPQAPGKLPESSSQAAIQLYNARAKAFNQQAASFNACMKDYVDKAQNDIAVIQRIVHDAVADANAQ